MVDVIIENIIATAHLNQEINIEQLAESMSDATYKPDDFGGLVFHFDNPKSEVLLFPSGKLLCTGAKNHEISSEYIQQVVRKLKEQNIQVDNLSVDIMNIVASSDLETMIPMDTIRNRLSTEDITFQSDDFPGIIYHYNDHTVILIFHSGKIVSTGAKTVDEVITAFKYLEEKLSL